MRQKKRKLCKFHVFFCTPHLGDRVSKQVPQIRGCSCISRRRLAAVPAHLAAAAVPVQLGGQSILVCRSAQHCHWSACQQTCTISGHVPQQFMWKFWQTALESECAHIRVCPTLHVALIWYAPVSSKPKHGNHNARVQSSRALHPDAWSSQRPTQSICPWALPVASSRGPLE